MRLRSAPFTAAAGVALIALAALVLIGWAAGVEGLRGVVPGAVAMNPLTALCLGAIGVSLVRVAPRRRTTQDAVALALCALVAAATLSRLAAYAGLPDAGLDRLLFGDLLDAYAPPNRMAPNTALALLLCAVALPLVRSRRERVVVLAQLGALGAGVAGLVTISGYAFGLADLLGPRDHIPMAFNTGVAMAIASAGVLMSRSDAGIVRDAAVARPGGYTFRRIAPAAVLLPPLLAWVAVFGVESGSMGLGVAISLAVITGSMLLVGLLALHARTLNRMELERVGAEQRVRSVMRDLQRKSAELAAANEELEAFSYSVSHDLRAPLRSVTAFGDILAQRHGDRLEGEAREHLDRIRRAGERMLTLIDAMLDLARVSHGELRRTEVDVSALAREIADELAAAEPGRAVQVDIEPGLEVWADPRLVRIALENLIGNAWKYTGASAAARIEVGARPRAAAEVDTGPIVFYVRDNGAGFDPAYEARLYAPFQRLHGDAEFPGSGVGLATVRRIVNRHGGWIRAESEPGAGATFSFTLNPAP